MEYKINFNGCFWFDRPLSINHKKYLQQFCNTKRLKRNVDCSIPDPIRLNTGISTVGTDGEYFIGVDHNTSKDNISEDISEDIPPSTQPSCWCYWCPNDTGTKIDMNNKILSFHHHIEWLIYIIENFIKKWGYSMNGSVKWKGDDIFDKGVIRVRNNRIIITNN